MTDVVRFIGSTGQVAAYAALLRQAGWRGRIVHAADNHPHDERAVPPATEEAVA